MRTIGTLLFVVALPLLGAGRDVAVPRLATPASHVWFTVAGANENGFLFAWAPWEQRPVYGTTADAAGTLRRPATAMPLLPFALIANGDGWFGVTTDEITELDSNGALIRRFPLDRPAPFYLLTRAAFDGRNFFIVRGDGSGYLVDRKGHVLSVVSLESPSDDLFRDQFDVVAAPEGGFTVATATREHGVFAIHVSADGRLLDSQRVGFGNVAAISANGPATVIAFANSSFPGFRSVALRKGKVAAETQFAAAGAWQSYNEGEFRQFYATRLLPAGDGFLLIDTAFHFPDQQRTSVEALHLDSFGAAAEPAPTRLVDGATMITAVANSRTIEVVSWPTGKYDEVIATAVSIDGYALRPAGTQSILATVVPQLTPSVASDGVDYFAVWNEETAATKSIVAGRVARSGQPLEGTGIPVTEAANSVSGAPELPAVAFGGGVYLVVWSDAQRGVQMRRYSAADVPLDAAPVTIGARGGTAPAVAFGGGQFLVVWQRSDVLNGSIVPPSGAASAERPLTPRPPKAGLDEIGQLSRPAISWDGQNFVTVFSLDPTASPFGGQIGVRAIRVTTAGTPLDLHSAAVIDGASGPAIACRPGECLVTAIGRSDLVSATLHDDGALRSDAPRSLTAARNATSAAVAWDGATYVVAWLAGSRSELGSLRIAPGGEPYAAAVLDGVVTDPKSAPAVVANIPGETAIVIAEVERPWGTPRARLYFASELPPLRSAVRRRAAP